MYKLIITDFDGSLVGEDLIVSTENIKAIEKFREMGGDITIATGRRWQSVGSFVRRLNIKLPVILYNGAGIYDPLRDEWIERKFLKIETFREILNFLTPFYPKISLGVYWKDALWEKEKLEEVIKYIEEDLIKLFFESQREILEDLAESLKFYFNEKIEIVFSAENYLEILPKGCSKGNAMLKILRLLNISPKEVIAIGDYDNDLDMVEKAGLGVTLPNGSLRIKNIADYITLSGPEKALAEIVDNFIFKNFMER